MQKMKITLAALAALSILIWGCGTKAEKAATENTKAESSEQKEESNRGTLKLALGDATIEINYGRPVWGGKDRLAQAPDGYVWRMGMNEATSIKTSAKLTIGDIAVPAGEHTLYMKRTGDKAWDLVVNSATGQWGSEFDAEKVIGSTKLTMATSKEHTEKFTIAGSAEGKSGSIKVMWGTHVMSVPVTSN